MKKIAILSLMLISNMAFANVSNCKINELSYESNNSNEYTVVESHNVGVLALDRIALELGHSEARVELKRSLTETDDKISIDVRSLRTGKSLMSFADLSTAKVTQKIDDWRALEVQCSK